MWALWKTALFAVFQVSCGRVLCVHRDDSVHIVFDRTKSFNNVETQMASRSPTMENQGDLEVDRRHGRRSWGILSGSFRRVDPSDQQDYAHRSFRTSDSARCSNTAGLT